MRRKYLLSNGLLTSDFGTYIKDVVTCEFSIQQYSVPSAESGFNRIMDGVKSSDIASVIEYRAGLVAQRLTTEFNMSITVRSVKDNGLNTFLITFNASEDEYQVTVTI